MTAITPTRTCRALTWCRRLWSVLEGAALVLGALCLVVMLVYVALNVGVRYLAGSGLPATIELVSGWWMLPVAYFGWVAAERRDEHIRVTLLTARLGSRPARAADAVALFVGLIFVACVGWAGWTKARLEMVQGEYGVDSGLPLWPVRFVIPVAAVLMCLLILRRVVFGQPAHHDRRKELAA